MSQKNVEIVRRAFQARAQNDVETMLSIFCDDIEIDASRRVLVRGDGRRSPYWPGNVVIVEDEGPPRLERLLQTLPEPPESA